MRKILIVVIFGLVVVAVTVGFLYFSGKTQLPFISNIVQNNNLQVNTISFNNLGIAFQYPEDYVYTIQSSLTGRQNTFVFSSKNNTFRLIVLTNKNDIDFTDIVKTGESYKGWIPTETALLKKFCETEVCMGSTSRGYYIQKKNFIYDFTYEDPAFKDTLLKILDTVNIDDLFASTTFTLPDEIYVITYPYNWSLTSQKANNSKYYSVELTSPDYLLKSGQDTGYEMIEKGVSIFITIKDTTEKDIRQFFNASQMLSSITTNVKESDINNIHLLEYDYSFEGSTATMAEFITQEKLVNFRYKYASESDKEAYKNTLQELIKSIKFKAK